MAYKPRILTVPEGGTGSASHTAYAVLCGGTSSTAAMQSVAGVGSSGQVLTSNGASNLPTFQAAPSGGTGYVISYTTLDNTVPDLATLYFVPNVVWQADGAAGTYASYQLFIPRSGTITKIYGSCTVSGTLGTTESCTIALRLNNSTETNITTTLQLSAASNPFSNTGLSIAVSAGDYFGIKFIGPTFATNPLQVSATISILVT